MITKRRLDNSEKHPLPLDIRVRRPELPDEIGTAELAPHEIIPVMNHFHLIGLGIPDAKFYFACNGGNGV